MIDKILLKLLGGVWEVKKRCVKDRNKFLLNLYNRYLDNKGSYIGYNSQIEGIPIFPHGINGIFISGEARIGKNCVIFQQVTIGSNTLLDSKTAGSPTIGDNCYIGAGAKIIGNVVIGNNVRIGANCVVFQDVPSNSVVVTQPSRIINKENINNKFYLKNIEGKWGYLNNGTFEIETNSEVVELLSNLQKKDKTKQIY